MFLVACKNAWKMRHDLELIKSIGYEVILEGCIIKSWSGQNAINKANEEHSK